MHNNRGFRVFLYSFYLLVMVGLGLALRSDLRDLDRLLDHGRTATARVVSKHETHGRSTYYTLRYQFQAGAERRDGRGDVGPDEYRRTRRGDSLTITYLPDNPDVQRIGVVDIAWVADRRRTARIVLSVMGTFFALLIGYLEWVNRRRR